MRLVLCAVLTAFVLAACGDDAPAPGVKIGTVDELLARVCQLAADCVSATQEDVAACPADLFHELDAEDLAELERFTTRDKATQDRILQCLDAAICERFGGALSAISDSDLMETLRDCE